VYLMSHTCRCPDLPWTRTGLCISLSVSMSLSLLCVCVSGSVFQGEDSGKECGVPYESHMQMPRPAMDKDWSVRVCVSLCLSLVCVCLVLSFKVCVSGSVFQGEDSGGECGVPYESHIRCHDLPWKGLVCVCVSLSLSLFSVSDFLLCSFFSLVFFTHQCTVPCTSL